VAASAGVWLVFFVTGAAMLAVPGIAWRAWLRQQRPRSRSLLFVALATTAPLATALGCTAFAAIRLQSLMAREEIDPSERARVLAETISEAMNVTASAILVAMIVCACVAALTMVRRRRQRG
jgi:hypothetical protein